MTELELQEFNSNGSAVLVAADEWLENHRVEFDRCWPWLDAAIARFGRTHEKEHLWQELMTRRAYFFSEPRCAAVVRVSVWPTGLKELQVWLVGGNMGAIKQELYPRIEEWGRKIGCHRMIAYGRKGWLRVLDGWFNLGTTRVKSLLVKQSLVDEIKLLGHTQLEEFDP